MAWYDLDAHGNGRGEVNRNRDGTVSHGSARNVLAWISSSERLWWTRLHPQSDEAKRLYG
jgi:hypothetical protein